MRRDRTWLAMGALVSILLLGALLALSDAGELARRIGDARWWPLAGAAGCALLSYVASGGVHHALLSRLGHALPLADVARAALVSLATNRTLRSGGLSGFASLTWLLGRLGVPAPAVLSSTIGFWFLTNGSFVLLFACGVVLGAVSLARGLPPFTVAHVATAAAACAGLVGTIAVAWVFTHSARARRAALAVVTRIASGAGRVLRRSGWGESLRGLVEKAAATPTLAGHPPPVAALAWTALRLAGSAGALALSLEAVDVRVPLAVLVFAYTAGKAAGVFSLVPAGLGLIEASLAGVLTSLGVPYESALAVALLNRAAYHVVPSLVALALAGPALRARTP